MREQIKAFPIIGPALHGLYLKAFKREGERIRITEGPLAGMTWMRFMRTHVSRYIDGSYEPTIQQALAKYLKPGMVFYDVGANGGFFTLLGAKLVGSTGTVVAFEPHPKTAWCCQQQVAANGLKQTSVVVAAVSDKVGTARFSDSNHADMLSLKDADTAARTIEVRVTTLDHEITRHLAPDVLKIDIEGSEIDALRGAANLIATKRPTLLVEVHSHDLAIQYDALMDSCGYQTFALTGEQISVAQSGERFVVSKPK